MGPDACLSALGTTTSSSPRRRAPPQPPSPCLRGPPCPTSSLGSRCSSEYARRVARVRVPGCCSPLMALVPSLQERSPEQEPIPIVLRDTIAYLQAHGECGPRPHCGYPAAWGCCGARARDSPAPCPQLSPPRVSSGGRPTPRWCVRCSTSTTWVSGGGTGPVGVQGICDPRGFSTFCCPITRSQISSVGFPCHVVSRRSTHCCRYHNLPCVCQARAPGAGAPRGEGQRVQVPKEDCVPGPRGGARRVAQGLELWLGRSDCPLPPRASCGL